MAEQKKKRDYNRRPGNNRPGAPLKYKTETELQNAIDKYFKECKAQKEPYTIAGIAYHLGIDRRTFYNYGKNEMFFPAIKRAKDKIMCHMESETLKGKWNTTFAIFLLKNYGYSDKQEVENTNLNYEMTEERQKELDKLVGD